MAGNTLREGVYMAYTWACGIAYIGVVYHDSDNGPGRASVTDAQPFNDG